MNPEFKKACEFVEKLMEEYDGVDFEAKYKEEDWEIFDTICGWDVDKETIRMTFSSYVIDPTIEINEEDFLSKFKTFEDFKKCFVVYKITKERITL